MINVASFFLIPFIVAALLSPLSTPFPLFFGLGVDEAFLLLEWSFRVLHCVISFFCLRLDLTFVRVEPSDEITQFLIVGYLRVLLIDKLLCIQMLIVNISVWFRVLNPVTVLLANPFWKK